MQIDVEELKKLVPETSLATATELVEGRIYLFKFNTNIEDAALEHFRKQFAGLGIRAIVLDGGCALDIYELKATAPVPEAGNPA